MGGKLDDVLPKHTQVEMRRYLVNHQNPDGGFGLHIEGHSTMFGTVLSYVAMRLLGMSAGDESKEEADLAGAGGGEPPTLTMANARSWIIARGGAVNVPSWGKFYLCVLGVYGWDGLNPIPPEAWLMPYKYNPVHPGRFWCHCRMVYLPMSYLYGRRATAATTPLTQALRKELFVEEYDGIDWDKTRNACAKEDLYYPHPMLQDVLWWGLTKTLNPEP